MIIVELNGGLGNQLFQYAAAKSLALYKQQKLLLGINSYYREELPDLEVPRDFVLKNFTGITDETILEYTNEAKELYPFLIPKKIQKLLPAYKRNIYKEPHFHFDKNFLKSKKNVYLKGAWQSEQYFKRYSSEIVNLLQLNPEVLSKNIELYQKNICSANAVGIHIRRGDYLRKPQILEWHGVLSIDYYKKAISLLQNKLSNIQLFYFSDAPDWVANELIPNLPGTIVSSPDFTQYDDFYLMSKCQHNIIANSSFSWWAAYLNPNPNKIVIAPKKWFNKAPYNTKDLFPQEWILI